MPRLIQITDVLEEDFKLRSGDFIQVNTIWTSGIPKDKFQQKRSRFIFADDNGNHIAGVLFLNDGTNTNARNVFQKLQDKSCQWKIKIYNIECNVDERWRVLRNQPNQIILSSSTLDLEKVPVGNTLALSKHLPFEFIDLEEVDSCTPGQIVDVIGYAKDITKIQTSRDEKTDFRKMTISASRSTIPNKVGFEREIAIFGDLIKENRRKNTVYALLNVKAGEWEVGQRTKTKHKSLQTTGNTIIWRIDSLEDLPPNCRELEMISKLLPKKRTPKRTRPSEQIDPEPYLPEHPGYTSVPPELSQDYSNMQLYSPASQSNANGNDSEFLNGLINSNLPSSSRAIKRLRFSQTESRSLDGFPDKVYDFVQSYVPLQVQRDTIRSKMMINADIETYRMQSSPRGVALILNNGYYREKPIDDKERYREGCHKDVEYLREFLTICKFEVVVKENISVEELPEVIANFKSIATPDMDCCFVAILSHGVHGLVEMVDGNFVRLHSDIIHQFDKSAFPVFAEKPKIFLVQTCQDIPSEAEVSQVTPVMGEREDDIELESMIECYAAASGTSAGRDAFLGSHFVYVLLDTLMEHAHDTDLETILKLVQYRLTKVTRTEKNKLHCKWECHQFNKRLYFNPGI